MNFTAIHIWHKLLLLGVIAGVLCAAPTYLYVRGANKEIRDALTEIKGLAPASEIVKLLQPLQVHRDAAAAMLSGDRALAALRASKEKEVSDVLAKVRTALPAESAPLVKQLDAIDSEWKTLSKAIKDQ